MIRLDWNPLPHLGPVPINWYGLGSALGFFIGGYCVWLWSRALPRLRANLEPLLAWIAVGVVIGARSYNVVQNLQEFPGRPLQVFAIWEGGLAYFGGLFGAIIFAVIFCLWKGLNFWAVADRFAPAIAIGSAIGRISCGLDGMDYGTPTRLPWGIVYTNPNSYAPLDGIPRHPDQFYELLGDLVIAAVLARMRGKVAEGITFWSYLVLFSLLRFSVFIVRGNVEPVAFGLKNGQLTSLAILVVVIPILLWSMLRRRTSSADRKA
jgi:phosphatidylglycerol:prolipoprotein diacylglycerol transferase